MGFTVFSEYLALNQLINKLNFNIAYQGMFEKEYKNIALVPRPSALRYITDYRLRTIWYTSIYLTVFSLLKPTKTLSIFSTVFFIPTIVSKTSVLKC